MEFDDFGKNNNLPMNDNNFNMAVNEEKNFQPLINQSKCMNFVCGKCFTGFGNLKKQDIGYKRTTDEYGELRNHNAREN